MKMGTLLFFYKKGQPVHKAIGDAGASCHMGKLAKRQHLSNFEVYRQKSNYTIAYFL